MKLKSLRILKFRRFMELTIHDLPSDAKLILLLGPHGCGKSSLFDAFQRHIKIPYYGYSNKLKRYYRRVQVESPEEDKVELEFHGSKPTPEAFKKSLYSRSAYRYQPSFSNTTISEQQSVLDRHTVYRMIDTDQTVQNNYQRLIWQLLNKVTTRGLMTDDIMEDTIGDLQTSMGVIFGDICLDDLVVQGRGTFTFSKGSSRNFLYEHLSAGEKAAFDLLLDIIVNKAAFDDSLYCIDEPEVHLSTTLQGKLLKEIYRLIPDNSQLWLATHSIGIVRAAQEIRKDHPQKVVFLDMGFRPDGRPRDYDQPQIIMPAVPDHNFWARHYSVALDDLAEPLAPEQIVFCEGSTAGDDPALDESCYSTIFAQEFPQTRFVSVGNATRVEKRMGDLLPVLKQIVSATTITRFRDRDALTPEEIDAKRREGIRVMSGHRNIESMLLSDGVLSRLCDSRGMPDQFEAIRTARDATLAGGQHAPDDLKPAAQAVHHAARVQLSLSRSGESKEAFMRNLLAPLVTPGTPEYDGIKTDIFG